MKNLSILQLVLLIAIAFTGAAFQQKNKPVFITGKVIAENTGIPVTGAYVYTVAGEEEALTQKDGSFTLKTWQSLPVRCTVEHKNFVQNVQVIRQTDAISIKLRQK